MTSQNRDIIDSIDKNVFDRKLQLFVNKNFLQLLTLAGLVICFIPEYLFNSFSFKLLSVNC